MQEAVFRIRHGRSICQEKWHVCPCPLARKSVHNSSNEPFFERRRDADSRSKTKLFLLETLLEMGADLIFRSCTESSESDGDSVGGGVSILTICASSTVS